MKLVIDGLEPLVGRVKVSGSKNAALKIIIASLFTNEDVVLENVPRIENILSDLDIIKGLGVSVEWVSSTKLVINASNMTYSDIPYESGSKYRTAALLAAPILYRFGRAAVPKPGGCKIGPRPINRWVDVWTKLGFDVKEDARFYYLTFTRPESAEITFKINTVMGTECAILSSIFIPGETVLNFAASEPEVDDLISFLNKIGAKVNRIDQKKIMINGVSTFSGAKYTVMPDRIEAATFAAVPLLTYGDLTIEDAVAVDLLPFIRKLEMMKASFEFKENTLRVWRRREQVLDPVRVETSPSPGFSTDWLPLICVLATQAKGESLLHETIYTDRFSYVKDLNRMGAKVSLLKPSEVGIDAVISDDGYNLEKMGEPLTIAKVDGPTPLKRERLFIPDLRAGAALVLAALCADGRSEVLGVENLDRGYERFDEKLKSVGAKIARLD